MNIWIFNQYAHPPDLPGGTRHYDLGRELVKRGHNVIIFATSFHHYMHRETRLNLGESWKVEDADGVKFIWVKTPPYQHNDWHRVRNMVAFMLRAWQLGRKLPKLVPGIEKPDVVIGSSPHLLTPVAAYQVARHFRAPFIMEVRDLWPQTIIDMGELSASNPIIKLLQALERFLYQRARKIVTLLPRAHEYISACRVPSDKIIWIPNGADLARFDHTAKQAGAHGSFRVLYLGAHGQANALDTLIQAAKILQERGYDDVKIILVGDGPEKPRLIKLANDLGLTNVEFHDPIPKTEVPRILQEASATVFLLHNLPLYRYGISLNKLFDYWAAGKPIIMGGNPASNPVEEAQCGIVVPPREPEALAEAVIKLYKMPKEEREAMGRRGREYVEKYYDIRMFAMQLEKTLLDII